MDAEVLASGDWFADLSSWRKVAVSGSEAVSWLNDLVTADVADLAPGRAAPALLLAPTGGIRAAFTVAVPDGSVMLLQDPIQPSVADLLDRYVLSSDVALEDRTDELALFAFPGRSTAPDVPAAELSAPSCLGAGVDLVAPAEDHDRLATALGASLPLAHPEDVEAWRVVSGLPRVGIDVEERDLPQEAGLASTVSFEKGCYLGQEAVAKLQNLGHPRRLVLPFTAEGAVRPGESVLADSTEVGTVTSAIAWDGGTRGLVRLRWDSREAPLHTSGGVGVRPRLG